MGIFPQCLCFPHPCSMLQWPLGTLIEFLFKWKRVFFPKTLINSWWKFLCCDSQLSKCKLKMRKYLLSELLLYTKTCIICPMLLVFKFTSASSVRSILCTGISDINICDNLATVIIHLEYWWRVKIKSQKLQSR